MRCLKWILTSLFLPTLSAAAIPTLPSATPFYRSPDSSLPSGQMRRSVLEQSQVRQEVDLAIKVLWDRKSFLVRTEDLLRDSNCLSQATLKENSKLLADPRSDAKAIKDLSRGAEVEVLDFRGSWSYIRHQNRDGWIPQSRLEAKNDDLGIYRTVIDAPLRVKADSHSRNIVNIPKLSALKALSYETTGWIRVHFKNHSGFVDLGHLAGRADFAQWAWRSKAGWLPVSHREGAYLKTKSGEKILLSEITGYTAHAKKALVIQTDSERLPPLKAFVDVQKTEATLWGVSQIKDHGEVWWQKKSFVMEDDSPAENKLLQTDDLLKRSIFSYALIGGKKPEGLVSADGIWKTLEGKQWRKLEQFGDQDLPVAVGKDGLWYVGGFRSHDKGDTFEPFIRWENLARTIETYLARPPRYIKLQKIETVASSQIEILVDTGMKRLTLRSPASGDLWRVVR